MIRMVKHPPSFEIPCPCCGALLKVDEETRAVIAHTAPKQPKTFNDFEEAARSMKEQDSRRESLFRQSVEAQKHASDLLEKKFQEAVKKAKVALVCRDENPLLLGCVLEVKGIVQAPQTDLHRSSDIMAVLREEWSEGQGNAFIEIEPGHELPNDKLIALDPLLDFRLVSFVVTERSLEFFFT